jgi:hypothetical protein
MLRENKINNLVRNLHKNRKIGIVGSKLIIKIIWKIRRNELYDIVKIHSLLIFNILDNLQIC